jgi:hypothetical protein
MILANHLDFSLIRQKGTGKPLITVRPLICSASPREIPEFIEAMNKLPYDKCMAKYYYEAEAYKELLEYFLAHKDYTHMAIIPDDLVVHREGFELLKQDLEEHDYPVLEGICNLLYNDTERCGPTLNGGPSFYTKDALLEVVEKQGDIIQVVSEGFACLFIRRDILEKHPDALRGMPNTNTSFDWAFSLTCLQKGIPIRVDTRAGFLHLAGRDPAYLEHWYRGKRIPRVMFSDGQGTVIETVKKGEPPLV